MLERAWRGGGTNGWMRGRGRAIASWPLMTCGRLGRRDKALRGRDFSCKVGNLGGLWLCSLKMRWNELRLGMDMEDEEDIA